MSRSTKARRPAVVDEDEDWDPDTDSRPKVRLARILGPKDHSSQDNSSDGLGPKKRLRKVADLNASVDNESMSDGSVSNPFESYSYHENPRKKAERGLSLKNGSSSATSVSGKNAPPRIPLEASFDGSQPWLEPGALAGHNKSSQRDPRSKSSSSISHVKSSILDTSAVPDGDSKFSKRKKLAEGMQSKTIPLVDLDTLEDESQSAFSVENNKRSRRRKLKADLSDDDDEYDLMSDLPPRKPVSETAVPAEFENNGFPKPSNLGNTRQTDSDLGGGISAADDEAIAQLLQKDEYMNAEIVGELNAGHEEEQEGSGELNLMFSTLQKCDKIADALRQDLNSGSVLQDRYAEVDPSTAKIVTQAEISAACGTAPGDTSRLLKPYQLVGVNFMMLLVRKNVGGAILADEMGLGKTVQAVTFLALLRHLDKDPGPHLIVCPASVLDNWQRELTTWCPSFKVVLFHGNERASLIREYKQQRRAGMKVPFNVLLTCYTIFERRSAQQKDDRKFLSKWNWSCVLMDEAHFLKDRDSLRSKRLRDIAQTAKHRIMLTGTPLQNDLKELWALLEFLMPDIFDAKNADLSKLLGTRNCAATGLEDDGKVINHMKAILTPFVLRRVKADVMQQLVAKVHKVDIIPMVGEQATAYQEAVQEYRDMTAAARTAAGNNRDQESKSSVVPRKQIQNIFTQLRKVANHPLLIRRLYSSHDVSILATKLHAREVFGNQCTEDRVREELMNYNDYTLHQLCAQHNFLGSSFTTKLNSRHPLASAKCQVLAKLLPKLKKDGHRSLIFSQWTQMLDILEWLCEVTNMKYLRLDGSTQVRDRQLLVDKFNTDSSITVFLLSTRAGGQGLNLTGADTVIIHDVDFNPQMDKQAEDRCHRIGQQKPVTVYRLVTKDSVDESIYNIAKRKLVLDAAVLESGGAVSKDKSENTDGDAKSMEEILSAIVASVPS